MLSCQRLGRGPDLVLLHGWGSTRDVWRPLLPALSRLYDAYSFSVLPVLGRLIANDADSYRYLAESIRRHPDQETLREMMASAGFDSPHYHNLSGGIVAVHVGHKV